MQPSRPNRNGHPISTAFRFQSWSEVSHAKADGTRPSAIVHDLNAVDHDRRASTAPVPWRSLITRPDRAARYLPVATGSSGSNPGIRRRMPTDPAVSRPNSTSILTVQCNGAVVRSSGYTNPIYLPRRTAVLYRRNSAVYF